MPTPRLNFAAQKECLLVVALVLVLVLMLAQAVALALAQAVQVVALVMHRFQVADDQLCDRRCRIAKPQSYSIASNTEQRDHQHAAP